MRARGGQKRRIAWLPVGIAVIAALAGAGPLAGAGQARAGADLSVAGVSGAPGRALTGRRVTLRVKVMNRGGSAAGKSRLLARLAPDEATALADVVGRARLGRIAAHGSTTARVKVRIPASTPQGRWRAQVCVGSGKGSNDCRTTKALEIRDGSSWGRIEAARGSGKLGQTKALLFELYALRGDKRLPRAYSGPGEPPGGSVFANLAATYPSLSAADQAKLAPYMIQPRYRQSAWAPAKRSRLRAGAVTSADDICDDLDSLTGAWQGIKTTHAWFWARPDRPAARARARALATEFERRIWPKLTGDFKTVDDSDADLCSGIGDSRIDIYLAPPGNSVLGENGGVAPALFLSNGCGPHTSFIIIPENATRSTLAHEFMHVIQWAYPVCDRAPAWVEGTAAWAEDHVYHSDQEEHAWKGALQLPFTSMLSGGELDGYQAWPFWFSLFKKDGITGLKRVFNTLAAGSDFPTALEAGPSDGLKEAWKRYAVERFNQEPVGASGFPVTASFRNRAWDSFRVLPATGEKATVTIGNAGQRTFRLASSLQAPLTTWFNPVEIADPKVRQVEFHNDDFSRPGVVQAMLKLASGKWRLEDWSNRDVVKLCRDKPNENVVRMIIATSNASPRGAPIGKAEHQVTARRACSRPTYGGTISGTANYNSTNWAPGTDMTATWSGHLSLIPIPGTGENYPWIYQVDPANGGSIQYTLNGTLTDCTVTGGPENLDLDELGTFPIMVLQINDGDPLTYSLTASMPVGPPGGFEIVRSACSDPLQNGPLDWFPGIPGTSIVHSALNAKVSGSGALVGSGTGTLLGIPQTWQWNLTPGG